MRAISAVVQHIFHSRADRLLQRFSEDTVILAELVHLKEPPTSIGPEPAVDYVRRAVWGTLYADDACILSRSPQGLLRWWESSLRFADPSL